MIARFCSYGFLKDLRFFEPFLILALHARGFSFASIGGLIAIREITIAMCEIPTGALADGIGRRRCMIGSMTCTGIAFAMLGFAQHWWALAVGMMSFGLGEALRSGTHKALIFAWLQREGRTGERTRIYGLTRSWSRIGVAVSALAAPLMVWLDPSYRWIFWLSCVPALINLINLATYPVDLDHPSDGIMNGMRRSGQRLSEGIADAFRRPQLRALLLDSAAIEGCYDAAKGFLQPLLRQLAIGLPVLLAADGRLRESLLVGAGGAVVGLSGAWMAEHAHRLEHRAGSADAAARLAASGTVATYLILGVALYSNWLWLAVLGFIALAMLQNVWRPLQLTRLDEAGREMLGATTLSIEAQLKALATAVLAPAFGWCIDMATRHTASETAVLWPLIGGALVCSLAQRRRLPVPQRVADPGSG